jgi:hypothetical protein
MAFLRCPNDRCGSHGPFEVSESTAEEGRSAHRVLLCPLCSSVIAVLDTGQRDARLLDDSKQKLRSLETAVRSIQSGITHLRSQLSALQSKMTRRH